MGGEEPKQKCEGGLLMTRGMYFTEREEVAMKQRLVVVMMMTAGYVMLGIMIAILIMGMK